MGKKVVRSPYIVNAATGMITNDKRETADELKYFRVMPLDLTGHGVDKLFFDSKEQYFEWQNRKLSNDDAYKRLGVFNLPGLRLT
jgi:hypothetical protein